jgi:hypothetical protein
MKSMFFDIYPVDRTGVKSCIYLYHELKRIVDNKLGLNNPADEQMIYLGVEALGFQFPLGERGLSPACPRELKIIRPRHNPTRKAASHFGDSRSRHPMGSGFSHRRKLRKLGLSSESLYCGRFCP